ncbi:MAG: hypothetical protein V4462_10775 [Pseudomonadota bacterium]
MKDYIIFMHDDAKEESAAAWERYLTMLRGSGRFSGGSEIGQGVCVAKSGQPRPISAQLSGYLLVQAESIEDAKKLLEGNPTLDGGGTVEIRELPRG